MERAYDPAIEQFARAVLRQFPQWKKLHIDEASGTDPAPWYRITISSPTNQGSNDISLTGDGRTITVAWHLWHEHFETTSLDQKDTEFVQMVNLLHAIDEEGAVAIDEFHGEHWIRSQICAVNEDGSLGAKGSRVGLLRVAFWRKPTTREVHSWKGTHDRVIG